MAKPGVASGKSDGGEVGAQSAAKISHAAQLLDIRRAKAKILSRVADVFAIAGDNETTLAAATACADISIAPFALPSSNGDAAYRSVSQYAPRHHYPHRSSTRIAWKAAGKEAVAATALLFISI